MGVFVGRATQMHALQREWRAARSGSPRLAVVSGEPGLGKSRLLSEFVSGLDSTVLVIRAHCLETSGTAVPLAPVQELVHRAYRRCGAQRVREAAGSYLTELTVLEPALADPDAPVTKQPAASSQHLLFAAVRHLLEQLSAPAPVVVAVEDVHWADQLTIDLLRYLSTSLDSAAVLVVATVCTGTPAAPALLAAATRFEGATSITLDELDAKDSMRLAVDLTSGAVQPDADAHLARAVAISRGNPLYLEELLSASDSDELPAPLAALLLSRLSTLSAHARELVQIVSIGDPSLRYDDLVAVTGWHEDQLDQALRECRERAVVTTSHDGRVSLRHALIGQAVRAEMDLGHVRALHRTWALALSGSTAPSPPRTALAVAHHWQQAGEPGPALQAAWVGARAAEALDAPATQAVLLDRVVTLWPQSQPGDHPVGVDVVDVLAQSARSHELAGEYATAAARLDAALDHLDDAVQPVRVACMLVPRGRVQFLWRDESPQPWLQRAADLLPDSGHEGLRAQLLAEWANSLDLTTETARLEELASEALELARAADDQSTQALALKCLAEACQVEDPCRSVELYEAAISVADGCGAYDTMLWAMAQLTATNAHLLGRIELAVEQIAEFLAVARRRGLDNHRTTAFLLTGRAYTSLDLGRLDEADAAAEQASPLVRAHGLGNFCVSVRATVRLIRGDIDGARAQMPHLVSSSHSDLDTAALDPQAWLIWLDEGPEAAADVLVPYLQHLVDMSATRSIAFIGDQIVPLARYLRLSHRNEDPHAPGVPTLRALRDILRPALPHDPMVSILDATLAPVEGTDPVQQWRAAAAKGMPSAGLYWQVDTLVRLAEATPDRVEAQHSLDAAEVLAVRLGSPAQLDEIAVLRRRLADTPWPAGITSREAEVLTLVAEGLTNSEIGRRLFVSRSTVGVHISSILSKTGTGRRMDAVAWAREQGLV